MSKKKNVSLMMTAAAMLAVVAYFLGRRSRRDAAGDALPRLEGEAESAAATSAAATGASLPFEEARISSAPDAATGASELDDLFDAEAAIGLELSAQPHEHAPIPRSGDDEEAPSADELGRVWLEQATESEPSSSSEAVAPDPTELDATSEFGDAGDEDDETVREYARRHRISSSA